MARHKLRMSRALMMLAFSTALAGCGLLGQSGEPDRLAKWVLPNATLLGEASVNPEASNRIQQSADGRGYQFSPPAGSNEAPSRLYFVPVATVDTVLEADIRKATFPGGVATLRTGRSPGDMPESGKLEKLAETELEAFYLAFTIVDQSALCEGLSKPCDGVGRIILLGKLKGHPVVGQNSRVLMLDAMQSAMQNVFGDALKAAPDRCGFDPARTAVPDHIAGACRTMLKLEWARDNDFTLDFVSGALPLSPEALGVLMAEVAKTSFYENGELKGKLEKVQ